MPESLPGLGWSIEVDTADPGTVPRAIDPAGAVPLVGRSLVLLQGTQTAT